MDKAALIFGRRCLVYSRAVGTRPRAISHATQDAQASQGHNWFNLCFINRSLSVCVMYAFYRALVTDMDHLDIEVFSEDVQHQCDSWQALHQEMKVLISPMLCDNEHLQTNDRVE